MTTDTLPLTTWLLEQIAADEAEARRKGADAMTGYRWKHAPENVYQELQGEVLANSRHVLAQCAAHRAIVEKAERAEAAFDQQINPATSTAVMAMLEVVTMLLPIYADHPDFDPSWLAS